MHTDQQEFIDWLVRQHPDGGEVKLSMKQEATRFQNETGNQSPMQTLLRDISSIDPRIRLVRSNGPKGRTYLLQPNFNGKVDDVEEPAERERVLVGEAPEPAPLVPRELNLKILKAQVELAINRARQAEEDRATTQLAIEPLQSVEDDLSGLETILAALRDKIHQAREMLANERS